jgi:hypothetical protein
VADCCEHGDENSGSLNAVNPWVAERLLACQEESISRFGVMRYNDS